MQWPSNQVYQSLEIQVQVLKEMERVRYTKNAWMALYAMTSESDGGSA